MWYIKLVVEDIYFSVQTPKGIIVRTTKSYWTRITTLKHPSIAKYEKQVKETLLKPDEIRKSQQDERVQLYYKHIGKLNICVVVDHIQETEGYIITAYLTDRIKEGEQIYVKT